MTCYEQGKKKLNCNRYLCENRSGVEGRKERKEMGRGKTGELSWPAKSSVDQVYGDGTEKEKKVGQ